MSCAGSTAGGIKVSRFIILGSMLYRSLYRMMRPHGIRPIRKPAKGRYDAVVIAVGHRQFRELGISAVRRFARRNHVLYDIKYVFERHQTDGRL